MKALILAGGSGTRLWPLSRQKNPKQLHALIGPKSLMTQTIERFTPLVAASDIWIVTAESYAQQIAGQSPGILRDQIIEEPFPLGTNLAVGLGLTHILKHCPDATVVICWADAYIGNVPLFLETLKRAEKLAQDFDGVIVSVPPTKPATGYGYVEVGEPINGSKDAFTVSKFEEKPGLTSAKRFVKGGRHFWNTGITVCRASKLLRLINKFTPDHSDALARIAKSIGTPEESSQMENYFRGLEKTAIDTAVFEKATDMAVMTVDLKWNDVGSWSAIYDVQSAGNDNVTQGATVSIDTHNCLIYSQKRLIATLGVSDLVIVETEDSVLIAHKDETERLKDLHHEVKIFGGTKFL